MLGGQHRDKLYRIFCVQEGVIFSIHNKAQFPFLVHPFDYQLVLFTGRKEKQGNPLFKGQQH